MSTENVQEAAAAAAEKLAEEISPGEDAAEELLGGEVDQWSLLTKAVVAVVVIVVCVIANKVIRGETPEDKRQRLRNQRRAKKKAAGNGPDEIDRLLSSIVRRQPGQAPPPGSIPISGRGAGRGMGGAGRGAGPAGAAAMRAAAAARAGAAGGRGNGAGPAGGRGPPPPGAADNRPKLRWDQSNEEVEIIIRVDPKVARSDVKVEVTGTALKLYLRNQPVIAGHLFQPVDPEGCTWQIDNPGPGHPKEVTITLLKAEPAKNRESWWRAPLKGLENRRAPPKPADPEMVRKAIEAIKAKSAAGGGTKLGAKPGPAAAGAGGGQRPPAAAAPGNGTTSRAAPTTPGGAASSTAAAAAAAAAAAGRSPGAKAGGGAGAGGGGGDAGAVGSPAAPTPPSQKTGKSGGKKKNRKKK